MIYVLTSVIVCLLLVLYHALRSVVKQVKESVRITKFEYQTVLSFEVSNFRYRHEIIIGYFPTCISKVCIQNLPDILDVQTKWRYLRSPKVRVLWEGDFAVECENIEFNVSAPRRFHSVPMSLTRAIQSKLYAINGANNNLCSAYRLICKCGCKGVRNVIYDFTPSILRLSFTEISDSAQGQEP